MTGEQAGVCDKAGIRESLLGASDIFPAIYEKNVLPKNTHPPPPFFFQVLDHVTRGCHAEFPLAAVVAETSNQNSGLAEMFHKSGPALLSLLLMELSVTLLLHLFF